MCTISMIGDHFTDKWSPWKTTPSPTHPIDFTDALNPIVRKNELEQLRREVEDMKKLLERALEYDKKNNEPHCEMEEKVKLLKEIAKLVGVDLEEIFKK